MRHHLLKKLIKLHHPKQKRTIVDYRSGRQVTQISTLEDGVYRGMRFFLEKSPSKVTYVPENAPPGVAFHLGKEDIALSPLQAAHDLLTKGNAFIPADHARYVDENNPDAGVVICAEDGTPSVLIPTEVYDQIRKENVHADKRYNPTRFA